MTNTTTEEGSLSQKELKRLDKAVDRGAALLDKKKPGWWKQIVFKNLDMGDSCRCVLGQVYERDAKPARGDVVSGYWWDVSGYWWALEEGPLLGVNAEHYGFDVPNYDYEDDFTQGYKHLRARWMDKVRERKAAAKAAKPKVDA